MKEEAEIFKSLVDAVVSKNLEQIDKVEESLMELQQNQDKTYSGYSYLKAIVKDFLGCLSTGPLDLREGLNSVKANPENIIIKPIETDCTVETCRETDKIRQRKIRSETNIVSLFLCHQRRGVPCSRCRGSKPYCSRYNKHTLAQ